VNTSEDCIRGAWQALLRGDLAERDRLCARVKQLIEAERYNDAVERIMSVDFYVTSQGVVIPTPMMAKAANALQ